MSSPTASTWPTTGGDIDVVAPGNIVWTTVKTEDEEYLDKLQSKLSHIMKNGPKPPSTRMENTNRDPDDLPDVSGGMQSLPDDDPGLHLLCDFRPPDRRSPSPTPSARSDPVSKPIARPRVVRFRSRVRITSGVHHSVSASSSNVSLSSSISAPLRGMRSEIHLRPTPLGSVLTSDAAGGWLRRLGSARGSESERRPRGAAAVDERSPLASAEPPVRAYTVNDEDNDEDAAYERMRAAARKTEEEVMFGQWPWRLINRHWWWWKLEPVICCCAGFEDESDEE